MKLPPDPPGPLARDVDRAIYRATQAATSYREACAEVAVFAKPLCATPTRCVIAKYGHKNLTASPSDRCDSCKARDALTHEIPRAAGDIE